MGARPTVKTRRSAFAREHCAPPRCLAGRWLPARSCRRPAPAPVQWIEGRTHHDERATKRPETLMETAANRAGLHSESSGLEEGVRGRERERERGREG
eukprot:6181296-Pleurochrysis_carterae.AAC.2